MVRYPKVNVKLVGEDGNAFAIIGKVSKAMRDAGIPKDEIAAFSTKAYASGSYDELLQLAMNTVNVR